MVSGTRSKKKDAVDNGKTGFYLSEELYQRAGFKKPDPFPTSIFSSDNLNAGQWRPGFPVNSALLKSSC